MRRSAFGELGLFPMWLTDRVPGWDIDNNQPPNRSELTTRYIGRAPPYNKTAAARLRATAVCYNCVRSG